MNRDGSFNITPNDWENPPNNKNGFIGCRQVVPLLDSDLKNKEFDQKGRLKKTTLERLIDHIDKSEVLTPEEIENLIDALSSYLFG